MRDATLHDIKLNDQYCVTFREISEGGTETLSFHCYSTKQKALMEMSMFKYDDIWKKLASL